MTKQIIAVDIDDVLATSVPAWVAYSNQKWGTHLTVDDYNEDWAKMWGVDDAEARQRALHINTSGMVASFDHFAESKEILQALAERYTLVITSSRVEHQREKTLEWLDERFGGVFSAIHFGGFYDNWTKDSVKHTKADLLQSVGASFMIDDQPKHCLAAAEVGIEALLFGDYAWNRAIGDVPNNVTRVPDWAAVGQFFDGR